MPTTSIELHARPGTASTTHSAASTHNAAEISDPNADTKLPTRRYQVLLLFSGFMMIFQIIGINIRGVEGTNMFTFPEGDPDCDLIQLILILLPNACNSSTAPDDGAEDEVEPKEGNKARSLRYPLLFSVLMALAAIGAAAAFHLSVLSNTVPLLTPKEV
ncbi:hypothetical protein C8J57DRAFT_1540737 [Mycena rebaudengoi]|nr:hypothetical protein C8J57DRAFT_1540737 [Mycena rebaudengoi]